MAKLQGTRERYNNRSAKHAPLDSVFRDGSGGVFVSRISDERGRAERDPIGLIGQTGGRPKEAKMEKPAKPAKPALPRG